MASKNFISIYKACMKNICVNKNTSPLRADFGFLRWHLVPWQPLCCTSWGQCLPPFSGARSISLDLVCAPGPHSLEHDVHGPQPETTQSSTVTKKMKDHGGLVFKSFSYIFGQKTRFNPLWYCLFVNQIHDTVCCIESSIISIPCSVKFKKSWSIWVWVHEDNERCHPPNPSSHVINQLVYQRTRRTSISTPWIRLRSTSKLDNTYISDIHISDL